MTAASFAAPLRTQWIDDTFVSLDFPLAYASPILGLTLTVPAGFITDFDSTPRNVPLAYAVIKGTGAPAAVVHDWLYQTHRADPFTELGPGLGWAGPERAVARIEADAVFAEALAALGVGWKAGAMYRAVRLLGASSYASGPIRFRVNNRALAGIGPP